MAVDGVHGWELWKSDGTAAGTTLVKDINPNDSSRPWGLTPVGSTLFFVADDGTHGYELWRSDGTESGTTLVKNITPTDSSDLYAPNALTAVGDTLYFNTQDGVHGRELWKSDGTEAGTIMVKDINPAGSPTPAGSRRWAARSSSWPMTGCIALSCGRVMVWQLAPP